jgi:hypothetical protein
VKSGGFIFPEDAEVEVDLGRGGDLHAGHMIHGETSGGQAEIIVALDEPPLGKALAVTDRIAGAGGVLRGRGRGMTILRVRAAGPGEGFARLAGVVAI